MHIYSSKSPFKNPVTTSIWCSKKYLIATIDIRMRMDVNFFTGEKVSE